MKIQLYYPIKPHILTQNFGDSLACVENSNLPITQRKIVGKNAGKCPFNYVDLYPLLGMKGHTGMDIGAKHGQALYHCGPEGIVQEIQTEVERGLGLGIITKEKFQFNEFDNDEAAYQAKLRYWHLKSFNVKMGDTVKLGDLIGYCDNTGVSAGDHLHLELKPVNQNGSSYSNVLQSNGYFGSIDPKPYFVGEYAIQQRKITSTNSFFNTDMKYMQGSNEIKRLQGVLSDLGYFTYPENTGYYGDITKEAVYNFQLDYVQLSWWERYILRGKTVGPKTRFAINNLINSLINK